MLTRLQLQNLYESDPEKLLELYSSLESLVISFQDQIDKLKAEIKTLKDQKNKDSHNSSKPPSSDGYKKPAPQSLRLKTGRKPGGQPGHKGCTLKRIEKPDELIIDVPRICNACSSGLSEAENAGYETRQVLDIPPLQIHCIEYRAHKLKCSCGATTTGLFPENVTEAVQYGPNIKSAVTYLKVNQLLPYKRTSEIFRDLFNCKISSGTLHNMIQTCAAKLEPIYNEIGSLIKQAKVIGCDETGIRTNGSLQWLHTAVTEHLTHYKPHSKRGYEGIGASEIVTGFNGVVVHDGWAAYSRFDCGHALCNVHHIRELTAFKEDGQQWADNMITLLIKIKNSRLQAKQQNLDQLNMAQIADLEKQYQNIIQSGYSLHPPPQKLENSKRGRIKNSPERNLLRRLDEHKESVLKFMYDFNVPFGNNLSEQAIRMMKVRQKVSGCFRSSDGAEIFCIIRTYIASLKKQGYSIYTALQMLNQHIPQTINLSA